MAISKSQELIAQIAKLEIGKYPPIGELEILIKTARKLVSKPTQHPDATEVLSFLNQRAGKRFSDRKSNLSNINARLNEGFTSTELKQVIEVKVFQWAKSETMKSNLNPITLFRDSLFEKYLQEVEEIKANPEKFKQHVEQLNKDTERKSAMSGSKSDWFI